jgi:hypothetical protein
MCVYYAVFTMINLLKIIQFSPLCSLTQRDTITRVDNGSLHVHHESTSPEAGWKVKNSSSIGLESAFFQY